MKLSTASDQVVDLWNLYTHCWTMNIIFSLIILHIHELSGWVFVCTDKNSVSVEHLITWNINPIAYDIKPTTTKESQVLQISHLRLKYLNVATL